MGGGHGGVRRLTWAQVSARRMGRQGLISPLTGADPADAVAAMCGAHAQVLSAAELSVGLRLTAEVARWLTPEVALWLTPEVASWQTAEIALRHDAVAVLNPVENPGFQINE